MTQMSQEAHYPKATGELLLAGFVKHEDFAALVNTCGTARGVKALVLVERQPDHVIAPEARAERLALLHFADFDPDFNFMPYTSGRVFHEHGELRWEKQRARIHIVYTGKREYRPQAELERPKELSLEQAEKCERRYLLFGKRLVDAQLERLRPVAQPGDFAEVRIPRLLRYPPPDEPKDMNPAQDKLEDTGRVRLVVCEYLHPDTGINVAYRFKGLERFYKEKQQNI
jgi:hypothetical protein